MTQSFQPQPQPDSTRHLTHDQICDLLLCETREPLDADSLETRGVASATQSGVQSGVRSVIRSTAQRHYREHLDACLICASELDLLRRTTSAFRASAVAVADRELARHRMPSHFASLYSPRSQRFTNPTLFWAATALLFAAILPLGLISARHNPALNQPTTTTASTASTSNPSATAQPDRDAALLNSIDQDLSAAVPSPLTPLSPPTDTTQPEN